MRVTLRKVGGLHHWVETGPVGAVGSEASASLEGLGSSRRPSRKGNWDSWEAPGFTLFEPGVYIRRLDRAGGGAVEG